MLLPTDSPIYTVSQLTAEIQAVVESEFPSVWVEGEISNFHRHSSGHLYFTLKDASAQLSCVLFRNEPVAHRVRERLVPVVPGRVRRQRGCEGAREVRRHDRRAGHSPSPASVCK